LKFAIFARGRMHVQFIDQAEQLVDQANCFAILKYTILDIREEIV